MGLLQWVKDKLDGDDEPKPAAKPLQAPRSADEARAQAGARYEQKPLPGRVAQNSAAFEARLQARRPPTTRDAALSGKLGATPQNKGPLTDQQKQAERDAALSGNFSKVAAPARTQDGGGEWGAVGVWAPMEPPSDGVREMMNSQNWTVPAEKADTAGAMPDTSFEAFADLKPHQYRLNNEESDRIQKLYNSARAEASGYVAPRNPTVDQNMPLMEFDQVESAELTWDAYNDLSSNQKAAVDFNSLLVEAREKDLGKSYAMSAAERMSYDDEVTRLFGEGRGSDTIAKETVNLLGSLNMDLVGQDLDEYLSLERSIDTKELGDFKFSGDDVKTLNKKVSGGAQPTYDDVRATSNLAAVDTAVVQKAQEVIKSAMANPQALTYDLETLMNGPTANMQLGELPMGFGSETAAWKDPANGQLNSFFQTGRDVLTGAIQPEGIPAEPADRLAWLMEDMPAWNGYSEETPAQFMDFLTRQAQMLGQYGSAEEKTTAAMLNRAMGKGE